MSILCVGGFDIVKTFAQLSLMLILRRRIRKSNLLARHMNYIKEWRKNSLDLGCWSNKDSDVLHGRRISRLPVWLATLLEASDLGCLTGIWTKKVA